MKKEIIETIRRIISHWERTNDPSSPTRYSDIGEELRTLDLSEDEFEYLDSVLQGILGLIRKYE